MADLLVLYEHPEWFKPLWAALDRRGIAYDAVRLEDHIFDPADRSPPAPVVFNRLAMSAFLRSGEHAIFYTQALMAHYAHAGARVLNGSAALAIDTSKARQHSLFAALGLATPATRVVHRRADVARAASALRFPVMVKGNIGGSGAGMVRYDDPEDLALYAQEGSTPVGVDGVALVQEYVPARDGRVYRCETLGGRFLYALQIDGAGATFDLCPADVCAADRAGKGVAVSLSAYQPPAEIVQAVEAVAQAAHLDVGGVEYMIDDRDGAARFYDINGLSNFVADPMTVLGYDPHDQLVELIAREIALTRREAG